MECRVVGSDGQHAISDSKITQSDGIYKCKWTYRDADGFFVVIYPYYAENFDVFQYICEILEQRDNVQSVNIDRDGIRVFSIAKNKITPAGVGIGDKNKISPPTIVKIIAYECIDDVLHLYRQNDDQNTAIIQYIIRYEKKLKRGIFNLFTPKVSVQIERFNTYMSGLLYYTVSGGKTQYPISEEMMGKCFEIAVKNDSWVDIRVDEKYKKYFKCTMK